MRECVIRCGQSSPSSFSEEFRGEFDRVVMSPPYDAPAHVATAAKCLAKGGRLVALVYNHYIDGFTKTLPGMWFYPVEEPYLIKGEGLLGVDHRVGQAVKMPRLYWNVSLPHPVGVGLRPLRHPPASLVGER